MITYYRTQKEYDELGRDERPFGMANANARAVAESLQRMGYPPHVGESTGLRLFVWRWTKSGRSWEVRMKTKSAHKRAFFGRKPLALRPLCIYTLRQEWRRLHTITHVEAVSIIGTNNYPIALPYLAQDKLAPHGVCETTSVGYSHVVSVVSVRDERPRFARTARNVNVRDPLGILHDSQRLSYKHDQSSLLYLQESIVDHDCTCKHVHYVKPFICTC